MSWRNRSQVHAASGTAPSKERNQSSRGSRSSSGSRNISALSLRSAESALLLSDDLAVGRAIVGLVSGLGRAIYRAKSALNLRNI